MLTSKIIFTDIRSWIILFFVLRLFAITDPPLEVAHNWRQTTVTMVARNFLEIDSNILYPRIDIAGEKTGITGMEFPFLNYLIYLISVVFGYAHWYGRLVNLIVSSFGLLFFNKLLIKYFDPTLAFNATFILLFSVWFNYSRKIMPDTFSMSFLIAGIYYGTNFLDQKKNIKNLVLFFMLSLIGILSKLPSAYLLVVFLFFSKGKNTNNAQKLFFLGSLSFAAALVSVFYFYWVPFLVRTYGFSHFFMGKNFAEGFAEIYAHRGEAAEKFYLEALQIVGFVTFIAGLTLLVIKREKTLLILFLLLFSSFLVIIFKAGFAFYHHSYYIIPFAPVMALVAGYAVLQVPNKKIAWSLLLIIALENVLNKFHDYHISDKNLAILALEKDLAKFSNTEDLILINSGNVPTPMYFSHHKGWVDFNENIAMPAYLDQLKQQGLKFVVILKQTFGKNMELKYEKIFDNKHYSIYRL